MQKTKVSIIIPVYNVEKFLDECVHSIISQKYKNIEVILVNDGSTDNSPQMCNKWAKKDSRIKVIHKTNGGVSSARNAGLEIATGEYVTMLDSDDWFTPRFSNCLDFVVADDADIIIFPIKNIDFKNEIIELNENSFKTLIKKHEIDINSSCSKFYKNNFIKGLKYSEGVTVGEDKEFVIKYLLKSKKVKIVNLPFYHYRENPDSCMNNKGFKLITKLIDSTKKVFTNIETYDCSNVLKEMIKEEFSSNLYGALRFYPNCSKEEKKIVKNEIKNCLNILKFTKDKTKKLLYNIMKIFGVGFGLNSLNLLRKLKVVD